MDDLSGTDEEVEATQHIDLSIVSSAGVCSWLLITASVTLGGFQYINTHTPTQTHTHTHTHYAI